MGTQETDGPGDDSAAPARAATSIGRRLARSVVLMLATALLTIVGALGVFLHGTLGGEAQRTLAEAAASAGRSVRVEVGGAINLAATVASTVASMQKNPPGRDPVIDMVAAMAGPYVQVVGAALMFERNAFDAADDVYRSFKVVGTRPDGRFATRFRRAADGRLVPETLQGDNGGPDSSWYDMPLHLQRMVLSITRRPGEEAGAGWVVTVAVPILFADRAIGVVAIDFSLARLGADLAGLRPLEAGRVLLASHDLRWVAHPDPAMAGQVVRMDDPYAPLIADAQFGTASATVAIDGATQRVLASGVSFERVADQWTVLVAVPEQAVFGPLWSALLHGGALSALLLALSAVAAWVVGRGVSRPVVAMAHAVFELAADRIDFEIPNLGRRDEIGRLAESLATLRAHAIERQIYIARQVGVLQEIEARVEGRTRELALALDHLRRTQDELVRSEKLAALGGMVASVAHEINTPIGNALTVSTTLAEKARDFRDVVKGRELRRSLLMEFCQSLEHATELIEGNLQRAADLVSGFKRVAVDQTTEARRSFDLAEVTGQVVTMLKPTHKGSGHEVTLAVPAGIVLDGYPGAYGQVITNLVNNAFIHAFDGRSDGRILVRVTGRDPHAVTLDVEDDGNGIAPEHLPRIFDPFFTTKFGAGGSGLGLHIVYALVMRVLGGRIDVESTPGAGTRFTLQLPLLAPITSHPEMESTHA